jgi:glycosyltransferase involved in cell wall biosynthesis
MTRVHVLCNVYNEARTLPRMVESCRSVFEPEREVSFIFVDGRYPDWPGEGEFSTDDTEAVARRYGTYLPVHDYECEKRTAGLAYIDAVADEGDYVLYLDADETITSLFAWPERVGRFTFNRRTRTPLPYDRCRLYRWEPGLEFKHRHYDLYSADGELVASLDSAPDFQVVGTGDHFEKPRTPEKDAYFHILRAREKSPTEAVSV